MLKITICIFVLFSGFLLLGCEEEQQKTDINKGKLLFTVFEELSEEELNEYIELNEERWESLGWPEPERIAKVEINEKLKANEFEEGDDIKFNVFGFEEEGEIVSISYFDTGKVIRGENNTGNYFTLSKGEEGSLLKVSLPRKGYQYRISSDEGIDYLLEIDPHKMEYQELPPEPPRPPE